MSSIHFNIFHFTLIEDLLTRWNMVGIAGYKFRMIRNSNEEQSHRVGRYFQIITPEGGLFESQYCDLSVLSDESKRTTQINDPIYHFSEKPLEKKEPLDLADIEVVKMLCTVGPVEIGGQIYRIRVRRGVVELYTVPDMGTTIEECQEEPIALDSFLKTTGQEIKACFIEAWNGVKAELLEEVKKQNQNTVNEVKEESRFPFSAQDLTTIREFLLEWGGSYIEVHRPIADKGDLKSLDFIFLLKNGLGLTVYSIQSKKLYDMDNLSSLNFLDMVEKGERNLYRRPQFEKEDICKNTRKGRPFTMFGFEKFSRIVKGGPVILNGCLYEYKFSNDVSNGGVVFTSSTGKYIISVKHGEVIAQPVNPSTHPFF